VKATFVHCNRPYNQDQDVVAYDTDTIVVAFGLDVDVDSDNNGILDHSHQEDEVEDTEDDPSEPGKIIMVNDGDADSDGIPDFADGYNRDGLSVTDEELKDDTCEGVSFTPVVIELSGAFDPETTALDISYDASDPDGVTYNAETGEYTPAAGSIRLWLYGGDTRNMLPANAEDPEDRGDYVPPGVYTMEMLGLSEEVTSVTLYIEAIRPSESPGDIAITIAAYPDGDVGEPEALVLEDTVRCTLIQLEYVVLGTYDSEGLPAPNAEPVPADGLAVSDAQPTVTLDTLTASSVTLNPTAGTASLVLSGVVRDPVADNVPPGEGADIASVDVTLNGTAVATALAVQRQSDGAASFWRQHPYRGTFDPIPLTIPLTEGCQVLRVKTSENASGNVGFAEVGVIFYKQEIPGGTAGGGDTVLANISFSGQPSESIPDTVRYYYGDRSPDVDDPTLSEVPVAIAQFPAPGASDIAVDALAEYVVDSAGNRVMKLDREGNVIGEWTCSEIPGTESFDAPSGVCVGAGGYIYVADTGNNKVKVFASDGTWQGDFGEGSLAGPTDVAVDSAGNIYVSEKALDRVQKYDVVVQQWSAWPVGATFDDPASVCISGDGHLYVAEAAGIRKFRLADGVEITWEPEQLCAAPGNIAVDSEGCVYVCDSAGNGVQMFGANGTFLTSFGQFDLSAGGAIAVDPEGCIYVAEAAKNRLQVLSSPADTFVLEGIFDACRTRATVSEINGQPLTEFTGFDPQDEDDILVEVVYALENGAVVTFTQLFTETLPNSLIFRSSPAVDVGFGDELVENIYIADDFSDLTADSVQHFYGVRGVDPADPVLTENEGEEDSLVFRGTVDGMPAEITITEFAGLTAQVDTLQATVLVPTGYRELTFEETGPETNLFRIAYSAHDDGPVDRQVVWSTRCANFKMKPQNLYKYKPFTVRVKGLPDPSLFEAVIQNTIVCDLEEGSGGWWYLKGGSIKHLRLEADALGTTAVKGGAGDDAPLGPGGDIDAQIRKKALPDVTMADKENKDRKVKFYYNNTAWGAANEIDSIPARLFLLEQVMGIEVKATPESQVQVEVCIWGLNDEKLTLDLTEVQGEPGTYRNTGADGPNFGAAFNTQAKTLQVDDEEILILKTTVNGKPQEGLTMGVGVDLAEVGVVEGYKAPAKLIGESAAECGDSFSQAF